MGERQSQSKAAQTRRLHRTARVALARWGLEDATSQVLATHHNAVFRIDRDAERFVLRLARPGYQSDAAIRSELSFLAHVSASGIRVPEAVPGLDDDELQKIEDPEEPEPMRASLFRWIPGRRAGRLGPAQLRELGGLVARLHAAAGSFQPPPWFQRVRLDVDGILGWGTGWRQDLIRDELKPYVAVVGRASTHINRVLDRIGYGPDRFGVIHGDLNRSNVVYGDHGAAALDFDDLAIGHFALDLAIALHTIDDAGREQAFAGYEACRPLPSGSDDLDMFIVVRRVQLMHWLAANVSSEEIPDAAATIARQADQVAEYLTVHG